MPLETGPSTEAPTHVFRTKTAVLKQLEQLKVAKPFIEVTSQPSEPVASRQSRLKFPDPKTDCCVNLKVRSQDGKLCWPVCYENHEDGDQYFRFILQVLSVRRCSSDEKELIRINGKEDFYCFSPFSEHKKGLQNKCMGFWFRFFGPAAIFRITIVLKIDLVFLKSFLGRKHLWNFLEESNGIVVSEEIDISTCLKHQNTAKPEGNDLINSAKIFPSLYLNQEYKSIVGKFKELRKKLNFSELDKYLIQTLASLQDEDLRVVLFLEQSQEACRKNHFEKSKQLLKQAVDAAAKCKNKTLLVGRAYLYLSHVHQKDGFLGVAEECLAIARKKLQALEDCEDVGDLCFQEGLILTSFAQKMPKFALQLINEAMHKFQQAAALFDHCLTTDNVLEKQCCAFIRMASLLLQQMSAGLDGHTQSSTQAEKHLEWVKHHLPKLSEKTKLHFQVCLTDLLHKKQQFAKAKESLAKDSQVEEQAVCFQKPPSDRGKIKMANGNCNLDDIALGYLGDESSEQDQIS